MTSHRLRIASMTLLPMILIQAFFIIFAVESWAQLLLLASVKLGAGIINLLLLAFGERGNNAFYMGLVLTILLTVEMSSVLSYSIYYARQEAAYQPTRPWIRADFREARSETLQVPQLAHVQGTGALEKAYGLQHSLPLPVSTPDRNDQPLENVDDILPLPSTLITETHQVSVPLVQNVR